MNSFLLTMDDYTPTAFLKAATQVFPEETADLLYYDPLSRRTPQQEAERIALAARSRWPNPDDRRKFDNFAANLTGHPHGGYPGVLGQNLWGQRLFYLVPEIPELNNFKHMEEFFGGRTGRFGPKALKRLFSEYATRHEFAHVLDYPDDKLPAGYFMNGDGDKTADAAALMGMLAEHSEDPAFSLVLDFADLIANTRANNAMNDPIHNTANTLWPIIHRSKKNPTSLPVEPRAIHREARRLSGHPLPV